MHTSLSAMLLYSSISYFSIRDTPRAMLCSPHVDQKAISKRLEINCIYSSPLSVYNKFLEFTSRNVENFNLTRRVARNLLCLLVSDSSCAISFHRFSRIDFLRLQYCWSHDTLSATSLVVATLSSFML